MKYRIIIIVFFVLACKHSDDEIGKSENYILSERKISKDCNAYQMRFDKGEYIFRFALSGPCKKLSLKNYIKEYSGYLYSNHDRLVNKKGLIIIEHNELNNKDIQDSILYITKKNFKADVFLYETDEKSFVLKVSK